MSKKVILFVAEGTEDIEAIGTADVLRRAGIEVTIASVMDKTEVQFAHDSKIVADCLAADADFDNADALVLPGGSQGTRFLKDSSVVMIQCRQFVRHDKIVASICAAPTALAWMGLLDGRRATCYPGCEASLGEYVEYTAAQVETDGNLITANGPGATFAFALEIVKNLVGEETAKQVASDMQIV